MRMIGDISVVGLDPATVQLTDIRMDVPHGVVVRIPADKAANSKDLWRAVSQRKVFRLQAGPNAVLPGFAQAPPSDTSHLHERIAVLEKENAELRAALQRKDQEAAQERSKFDEILHILRQGVPVSAPAGTRSAPAPAQMNGVVEVETPTFIPSTLKATPSETRVTIAEEASEGSALSDAKQALRRLRRSE